MKTKLRTHFEALVPLTDDEFNFVHSHFSSQTAKRSTYLIKEGEPVKYVYFVISGLLKLIYTNESGEESIVSFAMEDWWESDYMAFYSGSKAHLSLQCLEDSVLYRISLEDYQNLCDKSQKMLRFFLQKAQRGHIGSQQRIISFLTLSAKDRYEHLIDRYPALLQRVPKTQLASYLGVSRETLSRLYSSKSYLDRTT
ncbi:Crp/Fnr family transcriptional regulator [Fulvivirga sediminis]|uniref:Crp/Fnr family transcriptional regulator n=1 Tax=Fulvivirga sediminis TaxID=2803949 RepID=A0A937FAB2_9BACT|nr:Crp/Fnr family transcriptional regulator [Fulvivirga sediminis]MBL3657184.1 Crp/Fnr family transcriptional regulator [Fulvivirga sediminis]